MPWWNIRQSSKRGHNFTARGDLTFNEVHAAPSPAPVEALEPRSGSARAVAERFLQVFELHGIVEAQIPKFLKQCEGPSMTLYDLSSTDLLLKRLDDELLDFTQTTFALDPNWLRVGDATNILTSRSFYKGVESLARFLLITSTRKSGDTFWPAESSFGELRARGTLFMIADRVPAVFSAVDEDDEQNEGGRSPDSRISVGAIYQSEICRFEGKTIYRYFPIEAMPWDHWRSRYQIVAMMSVADYCEAHVLGRLSGPGQDLFDLCAGRRFPRELAQQDYSRPTWHPQYPYFGSHAWVGDPAYRERWAWYLERFDLHDYPGSVAEARESLREERARRWEDGDDRDVEDF